MTENEGRLQFKGRLYFWWSSLFLRSFSFLGSFSFLMLSSLLGSSFGVVLFLGGREINKTHEQGGRGCQTKCTNRGGGMKNTYKKLGRTDRRTDRGSYRGGTS